MIQDELSSTPDTIQKMRELNLIGEPQEALLTAFFNWAKEQLPTYRLRDLNTDLMVQHFIKSIEEQNKNKHL